VPCGPKSWYAPFTRIVNEEEVSLSKVYVFHMDECLDWQGQLLPKNHPYNFRTFMETHFYGGINPDLSVPENQRFFPTPYNIPEINNAIEEGPIDITLGGWGQDGHLAYNQTRRHPFSTIALDDLRNSTTRLQDNNLDTIITLGQRSFGAAYQFVPPMSVTLGVKQCLSAKKVRVYSDTGTWKQTALRVALFSMPTVEYPMTLLQEHQDALITATENTARHPISENPNWDFFGESGYHD
jgi:glucosamine-6-phosphate deaminase